MGMSIERAQSIIQVARRNIAYFQEVNKQEKTEMSIEEHKKHLLDIMDSMPDDACGDWRDSLAYAIDTMRKYQKIEEIVGNYGFDTSWICLKKIREVIEDGMETEKFQKKMVTWNTWNIGDKYHESTVICNDERSFKAICGLLERENLTPLIRNIYTIEEENGNDD